MKKFIIFAAGIHGGGGMVVLREVLENIQNKISRVIGVKVTIKKSKKTGKGYLKIYFDSKTWDRVLESLGVVTSWESDK